MKMTNFSRPPVAGGDADLAAKTARYYALVRRRESHFRRSVMADNAMAIMLSLFMAELDCVPLTCSTLSLVNLLDPEEAQAVLDQLFHAGLIAVTGENPGRRTVGLSALGSARMRSFVSDYPDV